MNQELEYHADGELKRISVDWVTGIKVRDGKTVIVLRDFLGADDIPCDEPHAVLHARYLDVIDGRAS